jgi:hypothetical protein
LRGYDRHRRHQLGRRQPFTLASTRVRDQRGEGRALGARYEGRATRRRGLPPIALPIVDVAIAR